MKKLADILKEQEEEYEARKKLLDSTAPNESQAGADRSLDFHSRHSPVAENESFDEKVYLFPEEFNALRRELEENWKDFFEDVSPLTGTSPAWCMVFDAQQFIGFCNGATGLAVQFDSENVSGICREFLNAFRKLRGVSQIQ